MARKQLTPEEFDALLPYISAGEKSIIMARMVLVNGMSQRAVAKSCGVTQQWVSLIIKEFTAIMKSKQGVPEGMMEVTAVLPIQKAQVVLAWERDALKSINQKKESTE